MGVVVSITNWFCWNVLGQKEGAGSVVFASRKDGMDVAFFMIVWI